MVVPTPSPNQRDDFGDQLLRTDSHITPGVPPYLVLEAPDGFLRWIRVVYPVANPALDLRVRQPEWLLAQLNLVTVKLEAVSYIDYTGLSDGQGHPCSIRVDGVVAEPRPCECD